MNDDNSTDLTEDQKTLVAAFNIAAEYFKQRLLDNIDTADETLEVLITRHGPQQASSLIAEESYRQLYTVTGYEDQVFLQAIKQGAAKDEKGGFFAQSILGQKDGRLKEMLAEDCKVKILVNLFALAHRESLLPDDYILNEMRELGQPDLRL